MHSQRVRTLALFGAGSLLLVQFIIQQIEGGIQPSGIVLVAAAAIFLGLGVLRIRDPPPQGTETGIGIIEVGLLALVGVLALITLGLAALVFR